MAAIPAPPDAAVTGDGATDGANNNQPPAATPLATIGFARAVAATYPAGDKLFAAYEDKDLGIFDLTDARAPKDALTIKLPGRVIDVDYDEERELAFVLDSTGMLHVIAARTAEGAEVLTTKGATLTGATALARVGDRLYALAGTTIQPFAIVTDAEGVPTSINLEDAITLERAALRLVGAGGVLFVGFGDGNVDAWSVSAAGVPAKSGSFSVGGELRGLLAKGSNVLAFGKGTGLHVIDFANPATPALVFKSDLVSDATQARLFGRTLLVSLERQQVTTLDLTDFKAPAIVTTNPGTLPVFMAVVNGNIVTGGGKEGKVAGVPPVVVNVAPAATLAQFPLNGALPITFSKPIDPTSAVPGSLKLTCNGQPVEGAIVVATDNLSVSFRPTQNLPAGVSCSLDVTGLKDRAGIAVKASTSSLTIPFTTAPAAPAPQENPGSKYKHTPDGKLTDWSEGATSYEWFDVKPARGMYTYFYADFDGQFLHLLNDWYVNPEKIDPDCYNQFAAWTGGGSERWDIKAFGNGRVEVSKNGQKLDAKSSGVEGGAGFGASPNDKTPHTIYELKIPAAPGKWGVQLHDPGPSFNCSKRLGDTSPMSGNLNGDQGAASSSVMAGGGLVAPAKPTLAAPADGAVNVEMPVTLSWEADNPADRFVTYVVSLGTNSDPLKASWVGTTTSRSLTLPRGVLAGKTQYFWRVLAANAAGRALSDNRSFTTAVRAEAGTFTLSLTKTAGGSVTSVPQGIDCGDQCLGTSANFAENTQVTLTAVPSNGKQFTGWTGDCTASDDPTKTIITMSSNRSCTATFGTPATTFNLTTNNSPAAGGTITINGNITCNQASCTNALTANSNVTLQANPANGYTFGGWSGSCQGQQAQTQVSLDGNKTCTATFTPTQYTLAVTVTPANAANVTATSPVGQINGCTGSGQNCSGTYAANTNVSLSAEIQGAYAISGWSGDCAGTQLGTSVSMTGATAAKTCTLTLVPLVALTGNKTGSGTGTIQTNPGGMNCGPACNSQNVQFAQGSQVQVTATPALGSVFSGWSGCSTSTNASIAVDMTAAKTCTASFTLTNFTLTVTPSPDLGGGKVSSSPAGITDCGDNAGDCSQAFPAQQGVQLSAVANAGYRFAGFSGTGCAGGSVSMTGDRNCTATFVQQFALTVATNGANGAGNVVSTNVGGINCTNNTGSCNATYDSGSVVNLTATPSVGSVFTSWSCSASVQPNIQVTMDQARNCTASFTLTNYAATVSISPDGGGTVSSSPGTMTCNASSCSGSYGAGQFVTLTANANSGFRFTGWSGDCGNGTQTAVGLTMSAARSCTATFTPDAQLTVNKTGSTGTGTVASQPAGISCGVGCSGQTAGYAPNTDVTLTATPSATSVFTGWQGCSTATTSQITVNMSTAKTCTAVFGVKPVSFALTITNPTAGSVLSIAPASPRIQCPAGGLGGCSADFTPNTQLHLFASPNTGFTTATWGGDCAGATGVDVTFTLSANRACTITFQ